MLGFKKKKSVTTRRKSRSSVLSARLRRFGMITAAAVFVLWLGAWLWLSGSAVRAIHWSEQKIVDLSGSAGLSVQNILVEGRVHSNADILLALINVQAGDPLFAFVPSEAKAVLEKIEWVAHAHVERRLPGTIYIRLTERQPIALWQKNKELFLLDETGVEIKTDRLERFKDLIIVIGEQAPQKTPDLIRNLEAEPLIYERAQSATWVGKRRWDLKLRPGITVKLPEDDVGYALTRLRGLHDEEDILDKEITAVDLRVPGKITVRTRPGAVEEYNAKEKAGSAI